MEDEGIDFAVYTDPGRSVYDAFGMQRGITKTIGPRATANGARAAKAGFRQTKTRGDALQIGGVVVIGVDGETRYAHIEDVVGDLADLDEVIAALG